MRGILGRKIGMTQVFNDQGRSIPVTVIETSQNVVTKVLDKNKNGYEALQLSVFDKRLKSTTKPLQGHFKKAHTTPKQFVNEIRDMKGFAVGAKIDGSIFKPGELVDVRGIIKGHGFQGNIKRHGQKIGPKSHGGGGGSQPVRQVGSLGDMVSNRVFKNMTMPGHMGVEQRSIQNLEVITFDEKTHSLLVKGSIPGPRKGFVIVTEAIKKLPSREATKLVNVKEALLKNELLEESKKAGADINTSMSVKEMRAAIDAAVAARKAEEAAHAAKLATEKIAEEEARIKLAAEAAHREAEEAKAAGHMKEAREAEAKAEQLEHQVEVLEEKEKEAEAVASKLAQEAAKAEKIADSLQVETEAEEAESHAKDEKAKSGGNK